MGHRIIVGISDDAQRAAARAGLPAEAMQTYDLPADLVGAALDAGASVETDGSVVLVAGARTDGNGRMVRAYADGSEPGLTSLLRRPADAADALAAIAELRAACGDRALDRAREAALRYAAKGAGSSDNWAALADNDPDRVAADAELHRREREAADHEARELADWTARIEAAEADPDAVAPGYTHYCPQPLQPRHHTLVERDGARTQARREAARTELRAWARAIDDLARAAADGYEVEHAVVASVIMQIETAARGVGEIVQPGDDDEERRAPRAATLAARDRLVAAVAAVEHPACMTVAVGRVVRVTEARDDDDDSDSEPRPRTCAIVTIACSALDVSRSIAVVLEQVQP